MATYYSIHFTCCQPACSNILCAGNFRLLGTTCNKSGEQPCYKLLITTCIYVPDLSNNWEQKVQTGSDMTDVFMCIST